MAQIPEHISMMPPWAFWTRDEGLTQAQFEHQVQQLRELPVSGTEYLLDEDQVFLVQVPYRRRN